MPLADNTCVRIAYKNSYYLVPMEFIMRGHPGGQRLILPYLNQDITQAFVDAKHSDMAVQLLGQWMEGAPAGAQRGASTSGSDEMPLVGRRRRERLSAQTLWNAVVFGIAGATAMAAVLCRQ
ncbi:Cytochrome b5-like Heme/Steroid binding domain containing protein [Novymonas esmeraldas]|uniref:Cytochrome b5-like Heme/Steroid binding domain containing protein n=1 Tax=Novymonas esmeraldas TaxID=1808958 RepID=A0AAW0FAQ5_9TRYP